MGIHEIGLAISAFNLFMYVTSSPEKQANGFGKVMAVWAMVVIMWFSFEEFTGRNIL